VTAGDAVDQHDLPARGCQRGATLPAPASRLLPWEAELGLRPDLSVALLERGGQQPPRCTACRARCRTSTNSRQVRCSITASASTASYGARRSHPPGRRATAPVTRGLEHLHEGGGPTAGLADPRAPGSSHPTLAAAELQHCAEADQPRHLIQIGADGRARGRRLLLIDVGGRAVRPLREVTGCTPGRPAAGHGGVDRVSHRPAGL